MGSPMSSPAPLPVEIQAMGSPMSSPAPLPVEIQAMGSPMSSPAPLPVEIHLAVKRGELQKVIKWLRKGGLIDAAHCGTTVDGQASTFAMLHTATVSGNLEMVRMLLKQGADVDLPSSLGMTALMAAAGDGQLSCLFVLLQHSANPDLQDCQGFTPLMLSATAGQEACVKALLRAKANPEFVDEYGVTALQFAEACGHTTVAELIRQHSAPPQPAAASPAAPPDVGQEPVVTPPLFRSRSTWRPSEASCRRWSSGCAREGASTRSTLV